MLNTQSFLSRKALVCAAIFGLILFQACKNDDEPATDCSKTSGATFTSNSGKVENLLKTKCGGASCHAAGGAAASHWALNGDYDKMKVHFDHMYESAITKKTMPPTGAAALTQAEIDLYKCWKAAGFPK
jgi:uncharacterized membrane protein